ncbi:MAG: radical SAM protein, partial [Nitrososphaerales archaeon]|nr:radical SAM protein [Nitrososphaerales archaeon]
HRSRQTKSIFLVTNGQEPSMLRRLQKENSLPTQLYLSMNASDKRQFIKIHLPKYKDCWERFLESLNVIREIDTRTVIRLTLIRGYNTDEDCILKFSKLIEAGNPHFLEVKSYMHIGSSIQRLDHNHMLSFNEVYEYSKRFTSLLSNFKIIDEDRASRIVLLQNMERYVDAKIIKDKKN